MEAHCKLNVQDFKNMSHQTEAGSSHIESGIVKLTFKTSLSDKKEACLGVLCCEIIIIAIYEINSW